MALVFRDSVVIIVVNQVSAYYSIVYFPLLVLASVPDGSCGAGNFSHEGSTPQISRAYSAIVLSLENFPDEAIL